MRLPGRGPILLILVSTLATVGATEGFLRLAAHRLLGGGEWLSTGRIFDPLAPVVGVSLKPGSTRIIVSGGSYTVRDRISRQGLRDVEHPIEKPPGVRRILVLGDSFMFGQGVRAGETLAKRLEAHLAGVEAINAGVPGYDLGQEYLALKTSGLSWSPDVVLLAFFQNDLTPPAELRPVPQDGLPIRYERRADRPIPRDAVSPTPRDRVSLWLRAHSLLFTLVKHRLASPASSSASGGDGGEEDAAVRTGPPPGYRSLPFRPEGDAEGEAAWGRAARILDEIQRLTSERGAAFVLVIIPANFQIDDGEWAAFSGPFGTPLQRYGYQERLGGWCAASAARCLDLIEDFRDAGTEATYFRHDLHWTAAGHDLASRRVAKALVAWGLAEEPS